MHWTLNYKFRAYVGRFKARRHIAQETIAQICIKIVVYIFGVHFLSCRRNIIQLK